MVFIFILYIFVKNSFRHSLSCYINKFLFCFFSSTLLNFVTSGPVIAFELMGENCVSLWRDALGPTDSALARSQAPQSIRARFGKSMLFHNNNTLAHPA